MNLSCSGDQQYEQARQQMVRNQLQERGISDQRVLKAFEKVPRHKFVKSSHREQAYDDRALPTLSGQTISQPYMVAVMTEKLKVKPGHDVLEIGTGSGYQTAILLELNARVYTVEKMRQLSKKARENLKSLGYDSNICFRVGDGTKGWPEHAPYERILVTAGAPEVPAPLKEQAASTARIVIPVGSKTSQSLRVLERQNDTSWSSEESTRCVFVPLKGAEGWSD